MPIILENISYTYMPKSHMEQVALSNISLTVNEGEFLGIIGHTGSGKSTLLQHMNGLMQPSSGRVTVDGLDLSLRKARIEARSRVGLVFQYPEYQLFEETVYKDVAFGPRNLGVAESEIQERVEEALALVGLAPELFAEKSPFDLSGGEKRRAALAGIFAMRPSYLLLDEPMAGLDPSGRRAVIALLQTLRAKTGCAIVMISHFMDDIAKCADRIAVLRKGTLEMVDTPERVFSNPEALLKMGLDLPQAAKLSLELQKRGMPVPNGIYKEEDIKRYLVEALS